MSSDDVLGAFLSIPKFEQLAASPSGSHVAFFWDEPGEFHLYIYDIETDERLRVGCGPITIHAKTRGWTPIIWTEAERLFFHRLTEDADSQIFLTDVDGTAEPVTTLRDEGTLIDVDPKGHVLYYYTDEELWHYDVHEDVHERIQAEVSLVDGQVHAGLGPGEERLAYTADEPDIDGFQIYILPIDGDEPWPVDVGDPEQTVIAPDWHPDGERLLVGDSRYRGYCGVYDLADESATWYGTDREYDLLEFLPEGGAERPVAFLPDGTGFLADRMMDNHYAAVYTLDGESRKLDVGGENDFGNKAPPAHGRFLSGQEALFVRETPTKPGELLVYDLETDAIDRLCEAGTGDVPADAPVAPTHQTYETVSGGEADIEVYDSGERPSPAVVEIYGASNTFVPRFNREIQFLVNAGYTVARPSNPATAYTDAEHANHAKAGDWVADQNWIDEERVGVFGRSHGGYAVYMQMVKHPEPWSAGVAFAGLTDFYGDGGRWGWDGVERVLGPRAENEDEWRAQSPIEHTGGFEGPLCIVHDERDPAVPVSHARVFRDTLEEHGFLEGEDFEYAELSGIGHVPSKVGTDARITLWRVISDFLERRV